MPKTPDANTIVTFIATIAAAIIGVVALQAIYLKGAEPPRQIEYQTFSPSDPLRALGGDASPISVQMTSSGRQVENLRIVTTFLRNTGAAPIRPDDIVEPISIRASEGWEILNVVSDGARVKANWTRVDERTFSADPLLLNPNDLLFADVYLSFEGEEPPEVRDDEEVVQWEGRIVNLANFDKGADFVEEFNKRAGPFVVTLWIWPVLFICVSFFITSAFIIDQFQRIGAKFRHYSILLAAGVLLINLCSLEALATIIFGGSPYDQRPPSLWLNLPIILVNVVSLFVLNLAARRSWRFA